MTAPERRRYGTSLCDVDALPAFPRRQPDSHKGDYGRVLCIAGSVGMTGAAILAGRGALRGGAGLVWVATPRSAWPIVAAAEPCFLTMPLPETPDGRLGPEAIEPLASSAAGMDTVVIGPGLGQSRGVSQLVKTAYEGWPAPIVLDADGLTALARLEDLGPPAGPRILTPHPGEFRRLAPDTPPDENGAAELAVRLQAIVVLKKHRTIVTDGAHLYVNTTGNPGMATGGSGDVLAGLIAALIGQRLASFDSAILGVWLHGRAGGLAAKDLGEPAMLPTDLLDWLPEAICAHLEATGQR